MAKRCVGCGWIGEARARRGTTCVDNAGGGLYRHAHAADRVNMPISVEEEYVDNKATGVEVEETQLEDATDTKEQSPWNPDDIRIHTKTFSLRQVLDMIDEEDIDLAPDYQRAYVWKRRQKSSLIESILLGIPMPSFYFNEASDGRMQVVDGVQRLSTIHGFARKNQFTLTNLEYLDEDLGGKGFDQLEAAMKRRFNNTQIFAHVIDPQTPTAVKFDVFKRINTGGEPLKAQEIRHCMSGPRARELLLQCTQLKTFQQATRGKLKNHPRMADREVVLRHIAFSLPHKYRDHASFDAFLSATTSALEQLDDDRHQQIVTTFDRAMTLAYDVFGNAAFRKRKGTPLNRALFDVWSVVLVEHDEHAIFGAKQRIAQLASAAIREDDKFVQAISQGTGDPIRVTYRFNKGRQIVAQALA